MARQYRIDRIAPADLHRRCRGKRRPADRRYEVVARGKPPLSAGVQHGIVLTMRVRIPNDDTERHQIHERQQIHCRASRPPTSYEMNYFPCQRAAFRLVLLLRRSSERLAEVLLVYAARLAGCRICGAVVSRHDKTLPYGSERSGSECDIGMASLRSR